MHDEQQDNKREPLKIDKCVVCVCTTVVESREENRTSELSILNFGTYVYRYPIYVPYVQQSNLHFPYYAILEYV